MSITRIDDLDLDISTVYLSGLNENDILISNDSQISGITQSDLIQPEKIRAMSVEGHLQTTLDTLNTKTTDISYDESSDTTIIDNNLATERLFINPPSSKLYSTSLSKDWLYLYHNTYNGVIGDDHPRPETGIIFTNTGSSGQLKWAHYMGIVKDTDSASSNALRLDFGVGYNLHTPNNSTNTESFNPRISMRSNGSVGIGVIPSINDTYKLRVGGECIIDGDLKLLSSSITPNKLLYIDSLNTIKNSEFDITELDTRLNTFDTDLNDLTVAFNQHNHESSHYTEVEIDDLIRDLNIPRLHTNTTDISYNNNTTTINHALKLSSLTSNNLLYLNTNKELTSSTITHTDLVDKLNHTQYFETRQFSYNPLLKLSMYQYLFTMENTDSPVQVEFKKRYELGVDYDTSIEWKFTSNENFASNPIYCVEILNSNHDNDLSYTRIKELRSLYINGKFRVYFQDSSNINREYDYEVVIKNTYIDQHYFEEDITTINISDGLPVEFYSYQDSIKTNSNDITTNSNDITTIQNDITTIQTENFSTKIITGLDDGGYNLYENSLYGIRLIYNAGENKFKIVRRNNGVDIVMLHFHRDSGFITFPELVENNLLYLDDNKILTSSTLSHSTLLNHLATHTTGIATNLTYATNNYNDIQSLEQLTQDLTRTGTTQSNYLLESSINLSIYQSDATVPVKLDFKRGSSNFGSDGYTDYRLMVELGDFYLQQGNNNTIYDIFTIKGSNRKIQFNQLTANNILYIDSSHQLTSSTLTHIELIDKMNKVDSIDTNSNNITDEIQNRINGDTFLQTAINQLNSAMTNNTSILDDLYYTDTTNFTRDTQVLKVSHGTAERDALIIIQEANNYGFYLKYDGVNNIFKIQRNNGGSVSDTLTIDREKGEIRLPAISNPNNGNLIYLDSTNKIKSSPIWYNETTKVLETDIPLSINSATQGISFEGGTKGYTICSHYGLRFYRGEDATNISYITSDKFKFTSTDNETFELDTPGGGYGLIWNNGTLERFDIYSKSNTSIFSMGYNAGIRQEFDLQYQSIIYKTSNSPIFYYKMNLGNGEFNLYNTTVSESQPIMRLGHNQGRISTSTVYYKFPTTTGYHYTQLNTGNQYLYQSVHDGTNSRSNCIWGKYNSDYAINFYRNVKVNGSIVQTSDERIKKNITPNNKPSLDIINAIEIYQYEYKDRNEPETTGFIAQQMKTVDERYNTDFVSEHDLVTSKELYNIDDPVLNVKKDKLYPHLIGSIKQLTNKIHSLEDEIVKLKIQNVELLSTADYSINERLVVLEKRFAELDLSKYFK